MTDPHRWRTELRVGVARKLGMDGSMDRSVGRSVGRWMDGSFNRLINMQFFSQEFAFARLHKKKLSSDVGTSTTLRDPSAKLYQMENCFQKQNVA